MIRINKGDMSAVIFQGETGTIPVGYDNRYFETGDKVYFNVMEKDFVEGDTPLLTIVTDTFEVDGTCNIEISSSDSKSLPVGIYLYDITAIGTDFSDKILVNNTLPTLEVKLGSSNE